MDTTIFRGWMPALPAVIFNSPYDGCETGPSSSSSCDANTPNSSGSRSSAAWPRFRAQRSRPRTQTTICCSSSGSTRRCSTVKCAVALDDALHVLSTLDEGPGLVSFCKHLAALLSGDAYASLGDALSRARRRSCCLERRAVAAG